MIKTVNFLMLLVVTSGSPCANPIRQSVTVTDFENRIQIQSNELGVYFCWLSGLNFCRSLKKGITFDKFNSTRIYGIVVRSVGGTRDYFNPVFHKGRIWDSGSLLGFREYQGELYRDQECLQSDDGVSWGRTSRLPAVYFRPIPTCNPFHANHGKFLQCQEEVVGPFRPGGITLTYGPVDLAQHMNLFIKKKLLSLAGRCSVAKSLWDQHWMKIKTERWGATIDPEGQYRKHCV